MNQLQIFLPCAAGVEDYLCGEVQTITDLPAQSIQRWRGGVMLQGSWRAVLLLNLHCRLAQRVMVQLSLTEYRSEQDLYRAAAAVAPSGVCPRCSAATTAVAEDVRRARMFKARFFSAFLHTHTHTHTHTG